MQTVFKQGSWEQVVFKYGSLLQGMYHICQTSSKVSYEFYVHVTVHRNKLLYNKTKQMQ
jgi:hypothetical protein